MRAGSGVLPVLLGRHERRTHAARGYAGQGPEVDLTGEQTTALIHAHGSGVVAGVHVSMTLPM